MSLEGMPYSYNKAVLDHPDMREFVEKVWGASCRKDARIAELEAENKSILGEAQHIASYLRRIAELEAALRRVLDKYEGENSARTGDYHLYDCDCLRCVIVDDARAALSTKEDGT